MKFIKLTQYTPLLSRTPVYINADCIAEIVINPTTGGTTISYNAPSYGMDGTLISREVVESPRDIMGIIRQQFGAGYVGVVS